MLEQQLRDIIDAKIGSTHEAIALRKLMWDKEFNNMKKASTVDKLLGGPIVGPALLLFGNKKYSEENRGAWVDQQIEKDKTMIAYKSMLGTYQFVLDSLNAGKYSDSKIASLISSFS